MDCNGEIPIIYNSVLNGARDERTKARDKREFAFLGERESNICSAFN